MKIRAKIVLVVLPLIITTLLLAGISSYFSATTGITRIAKEFLDFKATELRKYAQGQWRLLEENQFADRPEYVEATKQAVEDYARSLVRSATEKTVAFDGSAVIAMRTADVQILDRERAALETIVRDRRTEMQTVSLGGVDRVAKGFFFEPFGWFILVTEERDTFYSEVNQITYQTGIILTASSVLAIVMLVVFARYLTRPLTRVVGTMRDIISYNDLSERVAVEYRDETGQLAHTFNIMIGELEKAYNKIKDYAFSAVVSQKREQKIRSVFQTYVPPHVIDSVLGNPEQALVGDNRVLALLFSDIRGFTSVSEKMPPDELVTWLNRYFEPMVDIIMQRNGVVDKYIGDAIMAFWGTPVKRDDDALQSVLAGLEMTEALQAFNQKLKEAQGTEWRIGIGIHYGVVTVGNMGTERKMNYTVIGDSVNLASRMEGLTKKYGEPLLISESVHMKVKDHLPCRLVDSVAVKGKTRGVKIFTAKKQLSEREKRAWAIHEIAMEHYYNRRFEQAAGLFREVRTQLPDDHPSQILGERCAAYRNDPPPPDWDGVEIMQEK